MGTQTLDVCEHHDVHQRMWRFVYHGQVVERPPEWITAVVTPVVEANQHWADPENAFGWCIVASWEVVRAATRAGLMASPATFDMGEIDHCVAVLKREGEPVYVVDLTARQFWPCAPFPMVVTCG